jgi:hypothetical protein
MIGRLVWKKPWFIHWGMICTGHTDHGLDRSIRPVGIIDIFEITSFIRFYSFGRY